ncbi:hypothetical protein ACSBR1_001440 [Camellia fascicularis]
MNPTPTIAKVPKESKTVESWEIRGLAKRMPPLFLLNGIMLVDQVVPVVLAVTLVLLQVIPIVIVPLHMDQMQGVYLGIE